MNQTVSEFVLAAARSQAEEVLLDRRSFLLDKPAYDAFVQALDAPPGDNPALAKLLKRKPLWSK